MNDTVLDSYKENVGLDESSLNALMDNTTYSSRRTMCSARLWRDRKRWNWC